MTVIEYCELDERMKREAFNRRIAAALPHIVAALEHAGGTHRAEHVVDSIQRGQLQLWTGQKSAIVTEIERYPLLKACHLFLAGGELKELHSMVPAIEKFARESGCSRVTVAGRPGWKRVLEDSGYQPHWFVLSKELSNGQGQ